MGKYVALAKKLKMINAETLSARDIFFDIRALLKCRWGCEDYSQESIRCHIRGTALEERLAIVKQYNRILSGPFPRRPESQSGRSGN
jgi:predicted metal-binding protein